jgi:hypothetical protein
MFLGFFGPFRILFSIFLCTVILLINLKYTMVQFVLLVIFDYKQYYYIMFLGLLGSFRILLSTFLRTVILLFDLKYSLVQIAL